MRLTVCRKSTIWWANNETTFGYDIDGRLLEVNHPTSLQTRYRYDLVGKLLESRVADESEELWKLNYDYNLAGERLSQHSIWADGGNAFEYRLDDSGRLIRETINRWVVDNAEDWASGSNQQTAFALDGKLRLLAREDDLQSTLLDAQRWELVISEQVATAVRVAARSGGLEFATSVGATHRNGRNGPQGGALDASNAHTDYPHDYNIQALDTVGDFEGRMLLRHRLPLEGAFDIQVAISSFDLVECAIGLGVSRDLFQTGPGEQRFPTELGGTIDANGCDIVIKEIYGLEVKFNDTALVDVTPTKLRLKRFLDGSDWKLQAYYHDGDDWVTDVAWVGIVDDQELFAYLHLSGKVGYLKWSDFEDAGSPYRPCGFGDAVYESRTYDAGRSVDWTRIAWNEVCPTDTSVGFQLAVNDNPDGDWDYHGPSGAGDTYFTTAAGQTISDVTGRYARFKVFFASDGAGTAVVNDVQITHAGTSGSRVSLWSYDQAGNITEQVRVTDAGTETDVRTYSELNQIETSSGGWSYNFDEDGNLLGKDNGELEGCEKWEFAWSDESRLMQVKKGVYNATPALVNEFTVDYSYDQMGRLLSRDDGTDVTTYCWDGFDLFRETTGESVTEFLVPTGMIRSFLRGGELYALHCDGLSSVRTVTDSGGSVVAQMEVDAWGQILSGSVDLVPGGLPMGFVGGLGVRKDPLTGLMYMRQRWYSPELGRFISRDPIGLKGTANLYLYGGASPTRFIDPSGLLLQFSGDVESLQKFLSQAAPGLTFKQVQGGWKAEGRTGLIAEQLRSMSADLGVGCNRPIHLTTGIGNFAFDNYEVDKQTFNIGHYGLLEWIGAPPWVRSALIYHALVEAQLGQCGQLTYGGAHPGAVVGENRLIGPSWERIPLEEYQTWFPEDSPQTEAMYNRLVWRNNSPAAQAAAPAYYDIKFNYENGEMLFQEWTRLPGDPRPTRRP